jgi:hypothetical protein
MHRAPANRPDEGLGIALLRKIKRTAGFVVPLVFLFAERYWFHREYPRYVASIVNIPGTDLEGPVLAGTRTDVAGCRVLTPPDAS